MLAIVYGPIRDHVTGDTYFISAIGCRPSLNIKNQHYHTLRACGICDKLSNTPKINLPRTSITHCRFDDVMDRLMLNIRNGCSHLIFVARQ